jgi:hypothetical protein
MSKDQDKPGKPKNNQQQTTKKVFDVMRPGKAPASATSRPVIVGHKPKVKEDMFVPSGNSRVAAENPFEKHELMSHDHPTTLNAETKVQDKETPASLAKETNNALVPRELPSENPDALQTQQPEMADSVKDADDVVTHQEIVFDEPKETPASSDVTETYTPTEIPQKPEPEAPEGASDAAAQPPEAQEQAPTTDNEETAIEPTQPEEREVDLPVEQPALTDDQSQPTPDGRGAGKLLTQDDVVAATSAPSLDHAFVSHHKAHTKWWEWVLIFLLIIIVGLVALNFLLDAEVISLNVDLPHTHLLK